MVLPSSWEDRFEPIHVFQIKPNCKTNTIPPPPPLPPLPPSPPPRTTEPSSHMVVDLVDSARKGTTLSPGSGREITKSPSSPPHLWGLQQFPGNISYEDLPRLGQVPTDLSSPHPEGPALGAGLPGAFLSHPPPGADLPVDGHGPGGDGVSGKSALSFGPDPPLLWPARGGEGAEGARAAFS